MTRIIPLFILLLLGTATDTSAERVSVAVAKGVVKAVKAVPNPAPAVWHGLKWLVRHA
mgnify:CR=1 FL=1